MRFVWIELTPHISKRTELLVLISIARKKFTEQKFEEKFIMEKDIQMGKRRCVNSQHLWWIAIFCLVAVGLIAAAFFYYRYEAQLIEDDKYEDISVIAKLKADSIQDWRKQRLADVHRVAVGPLVRKEIARLLHDPMNSGARSALQIQLNINRKAPVYADALFLDTKGKILLSDNPNPAPIDQTTMKAIEIALKDHKEALSDFFRDPKDVIYIDVVAPILDNSGQSIAIIVLRSKAADFLYPLIQLWPTHSETAETLLIRQDGDSVLFLNELRHRSNTALNLRIPLTNKTLPAVQTVLGKYNRLDGKDYRGVDVLAIGQPILQSPWFIVSKVDEKEILTEVKYRAWVITIIVALLILISAGIFSLIYRNQREVERKKAEEKLHQSEEKYRTIIENIEEGYYEVDLAGDFTFFNDAMCRILGYSPEEMMGMNNRRFTDKENAKKLFKTFNEVYKTGKSTQEFGWQIIRKDGTKRFIEVSVSLQKDSSGKPIGFRGIARDVTERKRMEEELIGMNRALRMLSDTNQALIHITDEVTLLNETCRIIVEVGGYLLAWVGYAENDEAKTIRPVAHAGYDSTYVESANVTWADNERGRGPGGNAIRTGQPSIARNILLDPFFAPWREAAIERGYKSNIALPLISEGQTLGELAIYSVEIDAFDAREVEILKELADDLAFGITALRTRANRDQSEKKYRNIFENAIEGIYQATTEGRFITANAALAQMAGYGSPEEFIESIKDIGTQLYVHPEDRKRFLKIRDEKGFVSSFEVEFYKKDGSKFWVVINARTVKDERGNIIYNEGLIEDITIRKHAEEQLHQTLDSLKKSVGTTIQVLGTAAEARDPYTAGHQKRVADLASAIATEIGLPGEKIEGLWMAGSIHDIGKISIPAEILSKPTKLTNTEFSIIKEHPQIGYNMLKDVESPWPLADIVHQHHERMNGSGYPRNLKGDEILLEARILAVADVVEAMGSHRPYRPTLGIEAALEEITKNKGILYDHAVTDVCLKLFREKGYQLA